MQHVSEGEQEREFDYKQNLFIKHGNKTYSKLSANSISKIIQIEHNL